MQKRRAVITVGLTLLAGRVVIPHRLYPRSCMNANGTLEKLARRWGVAKTSAAG